MKAFHGVIILCVLAAVTLVCESAHPELRSVQSVPNRSLLLLHWFANRVDIDQYGRVTLTFDPNSDFGSHHYGNFERMLNPPPMGYQYYTVGNLNSSFPHYVRNPAAREYDGENRVRIIFSAERDNGNYRIHRVFLTEHETYEPSSYDPNHTYEISTNLLRDIRRYPWRTLVRPIPRPILQSGAATPTLNEGIGSVCLSCLKFTLLIAIVMIIWFLATAK